MELKAFLKYRLKMARERNEQAFEVHEFWTKEELEEIVTLIEKAEPREPIYLPKDPDDYQTWWKCPRCANEMNYTIGYCTACGQKLKHFWEGKE